MKMGACGQACRANSANHRAGLDAVAFTDHERQQVRIKRLPRAAVIDNDPVAVLAVAPRCDDATTSRCYDRRAGWRLPVNTCVETFYPEDRVSAETKAGVKVDVSSTDRLSQF